MHIISSYVGEDNMDWEKYIAETSNFEKLHDLLCTAHDEYYLELADMIDLSLFY